jgi:hypothetical protein
LTLDRDKLAKILGLLSSDKSGEIMSAAQAAVVLIRNASTSWAEVLKQGADCRSAARGASYAFRTIAEAGKTPSITGARRSSRPAVDNRARRRPDGRVDLCLGNRRSRPLQILQGSGSTFRIDSQEVPSGETGVTGRISKIGDGGVPTALYEAANVVLTRPVKGSTLKSRGMRLAARADMGKSKVALARKLAVVLHRMLADGTSFLAGKAATAVAR